jgi:DNA-binding Lrp family transcriptional regulator
MDALDRAIINGLQGGFPVCERPYAEVARRLATTEEELLRRIDALLDNGTLTRFGPLYHAERLGGGLTLAAMRVAPADFERVTGIVNAYAEVAHNYARDHEFNMWFVLATERPERIAEVIDAIERASGYRVYNMPKIEEYFVGLKFDV